MAAAKVLWVDMGNPDAELMPGDVFETGHEYALGVGLYPAAGYTFGELNTEYQGIIETDAVVAQSLIQIAKDGKTGKEVLVYVAELVIHEHVAVRIKAVEATCEKAGNREYYECSCGRLFEDADAETEIKNPADVIIRATGVHIDADEDMLCDTCGWDMNRCGGGESCPGRHFTDMPSYKNWAHEGIDFAIERGLVNGTTPTTFSPKKTMTRAMLVTLLWRYEGEPEAENGKTFTDVSPKQYYAKAVAWASSEGIVKGMTDTTFQPNGEITREQMAVLFYRYAEWKGVDMTPRADISGFPDYSRVSGYAREAFRWANATDLIGGSKQNGVNYLLPKGSATREQVATLLMRFIRNIIEE